MHADYKVLKCSFCILRPKLMVFWNITKQLISHILHAFNAFLSAINLIKCFNGNLYYVVQHICIFLILVDLCIPLNLYSSDICRD